MADERPAATAAPERRLAQRYLLLHRLAVGGMAEVWAATDEALQRPVAIKVLKANLLSSDVALERFRREAMAGAQLSNPNVVAVFDTISEPGLEAIVMELIEGPSLRERLDEIGPMDPDEVAQIAHQVLVGLRAAHQLGVIHRDLKPGNILLSDDGRVLLSDFGIAKATSDLDLTSDDVMLGTAKYLAPEQVTGDELDARTDLYGLGVVLYECLTGDVPFLSRTDAATALARLHQSARPVASIRRDVPIGLADLVDRCLRRERTARPADTDEALSILATIGPAPVRDRTRDLPRDPTPTDVPASRPGHVLPRQGSRPPELMPRIPGTPPPGAPPDASPRSVHIGIGVLIAVAVFAAVVIAGSTSTGLRWFRSHAPIRAQLHATSSGSVPSDSTSPPLPNLRIVSVHAFDPSGDKRENNDQLPNLVDGSTETAWSTELYKGRSLAGKPGVGVVVELERDVPVAQLDVITTAVDWSAQVFRAPSMGVALSAWGAPLAQGRISAGSMTVRLPGQGRFLLLWITDPGTSDPRYQMSIAELVAHG